MVIGLLQHSVVALLVYGVARSWGCRAVTAFVTALLSATSWAHVGVVGWISGTHYSISTSFYLCTLLAFGVYLKRGTRAWYLLSLGLFATSILFYETTLTLPLVLLAYHATLGGRLEFGETLLASYRWIALARQSVSMPPPHTVS